MNRLALLLPLLALAAGCATNPQNQTEPPEVAKSTSVVFDEIVDGVIAAVDEGREPDLRIPPADEWGNPFSVTNGPDFVKVESFGPDGKRSEDDFLLAVQWGDGFVNVRHVYFDEELKCQGEEGDFYDW